MLYNPPTGGAANDSYVGKNVAGGQQGSKVPPGAIENPQREIVAAIKASGASPTNSDLTQLLQAIAIGSIFIGTFGGTANALTATIPGSVTVPAVRAGMRITGLIPATNTTTSPTLAVAGFTAGSGATPIKKRDGSAPAVSDLPVGPYVTFRHDGTNWRTEGALASESAGQALLHSGDDTSTTANQIVVDVSPAITSYVKGHRYQIKLANALTGSSATANICGVGTRNIVRADGTPTQANDGVVGQEFDVVDDGTRLQIVGLQTALTQGRLVNTQVFKTYGTSTYVPTPGTRTIVVTVVGAGGAGAGATNPGSSTYWNAGGGGGGGGYSVSALLLSTAGVSGATVTIGRGGQGAANNSAGANGGSSSFGSLLSATGGSGATASGYINGGGTQAGGNGGQGSGGNLDNGPGQPGIASFGFSYLNFVSGAGGGSFKGFGPGTVNSGTFQGLDGQISGTGGGGAGAQNGGSAVRGGNGADGYVEIREYS